MLNKFVVLALAAGFATASFAESPMPAPTAKAVPVAEKKMDAPRAEAIPTTMETKSATPTAKPHAMKAKHKRAKKPAAPKPEPIK